MLRELVRQVLEENEAIKVVGQAGDGAAALDGIASMGPDVVLLDLSMPGMDGLEVLQRLKARTPDIGVVVLSGFEGETMRDRVIEIGADRYFEKGVELSRVRDAVLAVARRPLRAA